MRSMLIVLIASCGVTWISLDSLVRIESFQLLMAARAIFFLHAPSSIDDALAASGDPTTLILGMGMPVSTVRNFFYEQR